MIIYTNLMPARFQGYNLGPITLIRPEQRNNVGLHAHEEVHRKQFFRNPFMGIAYLFSAKARQAYEVEAYRAQLKLEPTALYSLARHLATHYSLNLTQEQAVSLLIKD